MNTTTVMTPVKTPDMSSFELFRIIDMWYDCAVNGDFNGDHECLKKLIFLMITMGSLDKALLFKELDSDKLSNCSEEMLAIYDLAVYLIKDRMMMDSDNRREYYATLIGIVRGIRMWSDTICGRQLHNHLIGEKCKPIDINSTVDDLTMFVRDNDTIEMDESEVLGYSIKVFAERPYGVETAKLALRNEKTVMKHIMSSKLRRYGCQMSPTQCELIFQRLSTFADCDRENPLSSIMNFLFYGVELDMTMNSFNCLDTFFLALVYAYNKGRVLDEEHHDSYFDWLAEYFDETRKWLEKNDKAVIYNAKLDNRPRTLPGIENCKLEYLPVSYKYEDLVRWIEA